MTPPPDPRGKAPRDKGFDAVWVDLLDGVKGAEEAEGHDDAPEDGTASGGGTKMWDDAARASRDDGTSEPGAEPEPAIAETRVADAGELARKAQEAFALREMERIMKAASLVPASTPAADPPRQDEGAEEAHEAGDEGAERAREAGDEGAEQAPEAGGEGAEQAPEGGDEGAEQAHEGGDEGAEQAHEGGDEGAEQAHEAGDESAERAPDAESEGARGSGDEAARDTAGDDETAEPDEPKPSIDDESSHRVRRDPVPVTSPPGGSGSGSGKAWAVVAVTAVAIAIGWVLTPPSDPPKPPPTIAKPPPAAPIQPTGREAPPVELPPAEAPPTPASATPSAAGPDDEPDEAHATTGSDEVADSGASGSQPEDASEGSGGDRAAPAGDRDPREPPEGTPEAIAAVFRKLPVSAADRPPVGGIGASGIHVDRIAMGSEYDGDCKGKADAFSAGAGERPSVCVRVVHPREREELAVHWDRKGGSTRRGKITVKPLHAYRTRAYLVLRKEDVGDWTVRILSSDGVELASRDFSVVQ